MINEWKDLMLRNYEMKSKHYILKRNSKKTLDFK